MTRPKNDPTSSSGGDSGSLTFAFNAGRFAANKAFLDNSVRIHRQAIYREMRRAALRSVREMDKRDEARRRPPLPRPKKPSAEEIVADALKRHLEVTYHWQARKTSREEFRRVARETGLSLKRLRRVRALLAALDLQQLLAGGRLALPRLGHLRLVECEPRRRNVVVKGKVGKTGTRGVIETETAARVRFRPSASLKHALDVATEAGLIVLENLERRRRRRNFPAEFSNKSSRIAGRASPGKAQGGFPKASDGTS